MVNEALIRHLESTPLETTKRALARGECGPRGGENEKFVSNWVAEQDAATAAAAASRVEAREEKALRIAEEANSISRSAHKLAIIATVISVIAIVVSAAIELWRAAP